MPSTTFTTTVLHLTGSAATFAIIAVTLIIYGSSLIRQWLSDRSAERRERQSDTTAILLALIREDANIFAEPDRKSVVVPPDDIAAPGPQSKRGLISSHRPPLPERRSPLPEPNGHLGKDPPV